MNQCLKEINTDTAYKAPQPIPIPPGTRIPVIEVHTVVLSREEAHNLMVKFADDITISVPGSKDSADATTDEVKCMKHWAASNK